MAKTAKKDTVQSNAQTHSFNAEISKVLKLVIHSLYTNKDIFLRELVSNASDACEKLRYTAITSPELLDGETDLKIRLTTDKAANTLTVTDSGIGMDEADLVNHLGTIAKSGTEEFFSALTGDSKKDASLIGQFGVGFYSAFMVAEKVTVITRKAGSDNAFIWESAGEGEFTIAEAPSDTPRGTSITLHLRKGEERYTDRHALAHIVNTYSDHISFPIEYQGEGDDAAEVINEGMALWTRPKADITEEQYKEFYHHVGHTADKPFLTLHNQVEGKLSYTNLLFVPSVRPFDLFHPDRRRRVKLYVKRVFITDENVDIIPHNLRFLRGIIDSDDLPLNISRETLQANPLLTEIRNSITKRVLTELGRKGKQDPEAFAKFWTNFGPVLKEGLCDAVYNKEPLLEVCRFVSTATEGSELTSLDDYISRMKPDQQHIYYLTGDRVDALRKSPQIEGFVKSGVEVILLHDHVDDFWVTVATQYKGKQLRSVLNSGEELADLKGKKPEDSQEKKDEAPKADMDALVASLKKVYGDAVKDVRATEKLTESPVCLAVDEGMMSMRMERFLVEHKQLPGSSARILEINPTHPVIAGMAKKLAAGADESAIEDTAFLLLDQARIIEGEELQDPNAFTRRLNALLKNAI
ncbi:MAG: molecular chaperone HtpG [Alphaproteobacteria bacterium]|nr:molecular chaperone HtpG [Alphaproteobacteria bacterium]